MLVKGLLSKNGCHALYREGRGFSHVIIRDVVAERDCMTAQIELVEKPGYDNGRPDRWQISSHWDVFHYSEERWGAPYLSLAVVFDDRLLKLLDEFCLKLPQVYTMDSFNAIAGFISKYDKLVREREESLSITS